MIGDNIMKTSLLALAALALALSTPAAWAGDKEKDSTIKTGIRSIVSDTVSAGKDIASGFTEGVDEGRKGGDSTDGARIAASKDDFTRLGLSYKVIKATTIDPDQVEVTLALNNPNEFPVRLTNLSSLRNVVLLDQDGFSYSLPRPLEQGRDVTALGRSATRLRYSFSGVEGRPGTFRFFDIDVPVN
jgi:hypothetical protein